MPPLPTRALARELLRYPLGELDLGEPVLLEHHDSAGHKLQRLRFTGSHGEALNGWFLPPSRHASPAVLYCHAHGGAYAIGSDELPHGRPALLSPWLDDLAGLGMAVLCLEMPGFGSRATSESALAKALSWRGRTLFGQMLAELWAGMDWLSRHPAIDADRIATLGISMGGTHAWWLAALDPRYRAAVSLCALADLDTLIEQDLHDRHGPYMTVPGLLAHGRTGQWAGLAAPTPLFIGLGEQDWSSPPAAIARVRRDLDAAYGDARGRLQWHVEAGIGHQETPAMRAAARDFLARVVAGQPTAVERY